MSEANAPMSPTGPQSAETSPSKGRRPRGRVYWLVGSIVAVAVLALVYTAYQRQEAMKGGKGRRAQTEQTGGSGAVPPADLWRNPPTARSSAPQPALSQQKTDDTQLVDDSERQKLIVEANAAPTAISGFGSKQKPVQVQPSAARPPAVAAPLSVYPSQPLVPPLNTTGGPDRNGQASKAAFLNREPIKDPYLGERRTAARSKTELKAGSVIPAIMVGGINSDLPGQIVGQVSRNVYDSTTGNYLLVPAGAKVVGVYDSQVVQGQNRVLVAWERIIFPDGSSISIGGMPGTDGAGYSGFNDKVNRHFWPMFRDALFMTVISAGAQLSQPRNTTNDTISASQIAAAALGQQFSQVGAQVVQRNMDRQPTLEIRPGYLFNVMITKDVILPPWRG